MRTLSILALVAGLPLVGMSAAVAHSTSQPSGPCPRTNMNAKCSAQDPEIAAGLSRQDLYHGAEQQGPSGQPPTAFQRIGRAPGECGGCRFEEPRG
jgi:hypothetical protein